LGNSYLMLKELSIQQVLDCMEVSGSTTIDEVYKYAIENPLENEADYPNTGKIGKCRYNPA